MNELLRRILNLPPQASTVARDIDGLHYFVITVTMIGAAAVGIAVVYFVLRYRRSARRGGDQTPDERSGRSQGGMPLAFEFGVIGFLVSLFVLWWIIGFRQFVDLQDPPEDSLDVYVTGKKWMWSFAYPGGGASNTVLYAPVDRPVRLVLSSRDVIHSFYVPAFRIKQDALPGRTTTAWFEATEPGTYDLFCAEYCGAGHSTMRGQIVVLSAVEYQEHVEELPRVEIASGRYDEPSVLGGEVTGQPLSLAAMGERVATERGCLRCHTVDGAPHIGPSWARLYGSRVPLAGGGSVVADEAYLTESMMDPRAKVHLGYRPVMPPYQGLLTAAETGALVEYIRSLREVDPATRVAPMASPADGEDPTIELPTTAPERLLRDPPVIEDLPGAAPPRGGPPPFGPPTPEERRTRDEGGDE